MTKEYKAIIGDITAYGKELHNLIPDTMAGFSTMAKAATQNKRQNRCLRPLGVQGRRPLFGILRAKPLVWGSGTEGPRI